MTPVWQPGKPIVLYSVAPGVVVRQVIAEGQIVDERLIVGQATIGAPANDYERAP